ncbi:hypothetical protein HMF7854_03500 [Sphingomonas ginkgonis]|uniref:Uncharacterized protein n=1 Tax=Sphingomonas ginkgonis TaxID=2315330 RepID=A0A3R9YKQ3_9SPHN|nr:hypothetical protein [Sphingomonas ginkgonis]RST29996.1 hypothetical protein HMF7854_03500 [Sphingomonas ginkgonis]
MSGANILFVVFGALMLLGGLAALGLGIAARKTDEKRGEALLIAGTMAAAFGLILAGFAIAYATTKPYDFNSTGEVR